MRKIIIATLAAASLFGALSAANAGGLIGDFLNDVTGTDVGTQLDSLNDRLGNPVDHGAAIVCDIYLPGCGEVMEGYYAYNRRGVEGLIEEEIDPD